MGDPKERNAETMLVAGLNDVLRRLTVCDLCVCEDDVDSYAMYTMAPHHVADLVEDAVRFYRNACAARAGIDVAVMDAEIGLALEEAIRRDRLGIEEEEKEKKKRGIAP